MLEITKKRFKIKYNTRKAIKVSHIKYCTDNYSDVCINGSVKNRNDKKSFDHYERNKSFDY